MATPKADDKIFAGASGAILYGDIVGNPWNWDGQPVRLEAGDYLHSTGVDVPNAIQGPSLEVYIYRRKGNKTFYKTQDDAERAARKALFTYASIVYERRYVLLSQIVVSNDSANQNKTPDSNSPVVQEKTEKERVEAELETQIYSKDASQTRHTTLVKSTVNGKWMLGFANGYTIEYEAFLALTPVARRGLTSSTGSGVANLGNGTGTTTNNASAIAGIPSWAFAIVGVLVTAILGLVMLSKPKTKKK